MKMGMTNDLYCVMLPYFHEDAQGSDQNQDFVMVFLMLV